MNKALLLSVRAEFAERIFNGTKTVELRRRRPQVRPGDYLIIYVPAPLKCIVGVVTVERVVEGRLRTLWQQVRAGCALSYTEFKRYFGELAIGHGVFLARPARLASPLALSMLRGIEPRFTPQGYKYLSRRDISEALGRLRVHRAVVNSGGATRDARAREDVAGAAWPLEDVAALSGVGVLAGSRRAGGVRGKRPCHRDAPYRSRLGLRIR
jgi:predicted transcriptional regulator